MDAVTVAGMGDSVVMCAGQPFPDDWRAEVWALLAVPGPQGHGTVTDHHSLGGNCH
jgi:hypothetical protein